MMTLVMPFLFVAMPVAAPDPEPLPAPSVVDFGLRAEPVFQAGGGVSAFTGDQMSKTTDTGGMWTARAISSTRTLLGAEAAYVGTAASVSALGLDTDNSAGIVSNGLEADLRLNLPMQIKRVSVVPFGFGGVGWTRFDLVNHQVNTSSMSNADNAFTVPFGGGLMIGYQHLTLDARFTYRAQFDDQLAKTASGGQASLGDWTLGALIGFRAF